MMQSNFKLVLLLCLIAASAGAQSIKPPLLNIGDPAPPLGVISCIKGSPVKYFEKGRVYVVEFWATWCAPCRAAMPHLSDLARQYKNKITFLSIDIWEKKTTSLEMVKAFVDSMGERMDYHVAAMKSKRIADGWVEASGESSIPSSFVVNAQGNLAWIGFPTGLDEVLPKVLNGTWDTKAALARRKSDRSLQKLEENLIKKVIPYLGDIHTPGDFGKPDSVLLMINEIVRQEPKLKYAPAVAYHTFFSLLQTDIHKAYQYGKIALLTSTYDEPACYAIIEPIRAYSDHANLPVEIYQLGAEAYRIRILQIPFLELVNLPRLYSRMAECYWRANEKTKAVDAQKKAIEALNDKTWSSSINDKAAFEPLLKKYENM